MKKDSVIFLTHILQSINAIERYLQDVTEKQFENSEEKQDLAVRRLEIIGEATKNIPMEFREQHPEIPWKRMAGMRDVVIHQYYNVDYSIIWDTVTNLLPSLKKQIEDLLS
ncbi:MAG TPA: DUF86 domain-containing protein [Candidatus Saccharimonadales bacterium]|nr:DUF86 domain-containing protein [Candidatus Saccharimonadales bacterium]